MSATRLYCDIDLQADGKAHGFLRLPLSDHGSGVGWLPIPMFRIQNGSGPRILLSAGNHGDEFEGQVGAGRIARRLSAQDVRGRLLIFPALNLPAALAGMRTSPLDGGNLNRSFPGSASGSPTQQLAHFIETELLSHVDMVIDLHSGGVAHEFIPASVFCRPKSADAYDAALTRARLFGAPVTYIVGEATGGDAGMIGACTRRGVAHMTSELGGGGNVHRLGARLAEEGTLRVLRHLGVLAPDYPLPEPGPTRVLVRGNPRSSSFLYALEAGLFEPAVEIGETVSVGQVAGFIHFTDSPWREPWRVVFESAGVVIARRHPGITRRGDALYSLGREWSPEDRPAA